MRRRRHRRPGSANGGLSPSLGALEIPLAMQITLMRHGKPRLAETGWVTPFGMRAWIDSYDTVEVMTDLIPRRCFEAARSAKVIATSTLKRATSSAAALGETAPMADPVFSEAELPHTLWTAPRLPPTVWAAFFRLLWLCGYSRGVVSLKNTRLRAHAAAQRLAGAATEGPVLLIGHGMMNRYIGRELKTLGWTLSGADHPNRYWGMRTYLLESPRF